MPPMHPFGLALGGGGARGLAHVGVLRVLEREGLHAAVIAGTSMGGLVGAFAAAGYRAEAIQDFAHGVSWRGLLDLRPGTGLLRASAFEAWLAQHLPATFEELQTPLIVTATDILSGRGVYLHRGPLYPALRATSAYPGAVDPVRLGEALLADGGILNQVPVDAALFLGARQVLAVDVTAPAPLELGEGRPSRLRWRLPSALGPISALRRSADIMQAQLTDARLSLYRPDILLNPTFHNLDISSFRRVNEAIEAGEKAAEAERERIVKTFGGAPTEAAEPPLSGLD